MIALHSEISTKYGCNTPRKIVSSQRVPRKQNYFSGPAAQSQLGTAQFQLVVANVPVSAYIVPDKTAQL
jgi:hypothetical protein